MKPIRHHSGKLDSNHVDPRGKGRRSRDPEALDSLPRREPMVRKGQGWREGGGTDYAQLRRWLERQVGRPWDEVYSEVSHLHDWQVKEDVKRWGVETNTLLDAEGYIVYLNPYSWHGASRLIRVDSTPGALYVDPQTRALCMVPKTGRSLKGPYPKAPLPYRCLDASTGDYVISVAGIWYRASTDALGRFDTVLDRWRSHPPTLPKGTRRIVIEEKGETVALKVLNQLDGRTLKHLNLVNSPCRVPDHVATQRAAARLRAPSR